MLFRTMTSALLLLAGASSSLAQAITVQPVSSVVVTEVPTSLPVPIETSNIVSIIPSTIISATDLMSIPPGETPIPSSLVSLLPSSLVPSASSNGTSSANTAHSSLGPSTTGSASPSQSSGAAPGGQIHGDASNILIVMTLSGLAITLGFALTLA